MKRTCPVIFSLCLSLLAGLAVAADSDISEHARAQGLAKAPALIKAAGLACTLVDARRIDVLALANTAGGTKSIPGQKTFGAGGDDVQDSLTRLNSSGSGSTAPSALMDVDIIPGVTIADDYYELACGEGLGYLVNASGPKPQAHLCIELPGPDAAAPAGAAGQAPGNAAQAAASKRRNAPSLQCLLPGNSGEAQLQLVNAALVRAKADCEAVQIRAVGHDAQSIAVEAACKNGNGYIVQLANPFSPDRVVHQQNCLAFAPGSQLSCRLTDTAAQKRAAEALLLQAQPACEASAQRFVGMSTAGNKWFEFLCRDGQGYLLSQRSGGELAALITCTDSNAAKLGGCALGSAATK